MLYVKEVIYDGSALASGVYFLRASSTIFQRTVATTKLLLVK